ncbi:unnamed protein product [Penicillium salamii]|uniref:JmjC domain-containing protein n=1 Tax=Penicillium salamii TaxID=1612424 RepID=A0A9W4J7R5_9EURO|nr:unnamed protein product [Penicillium salamii]
MRSPDISRADTLSAFNHLGLCMKLQWLLRTRLRDARITGRSFSTTRLQYQPLHSLGNDLTTFQKQCFQPEQPAILPQAFNDLPAMKQWFSPGLNTEYLRKHGGDAFVPLELTQSTPEGPSFRSFHAPLSLFLDWMESPTPSTLYLAQCQLLDLPPILRADFPTPSLVSHAGRGDIYDTNVWIGHPPTYTPLHRDPNPNLFVQLAGEKVVRLLAPNEGQAVFAGVRARLGKSGDRGAAAFRGEEMMQGGERALLDEVVWGSDGGFEARLGAGDGLFIPKGWWHSIKGVGEGVTDLRILFSLRHLPSEMQMSTIYRAALLHLSVNPFLARASTSLGSPIPRLHNVLPQCAIRFDQTRAMSDDNTPKTKPLSLPESDGTSNSVQGSGGIKLDMSGGSTEVKLDHLGPMVVNVDGTLSQIGNWAQMTDSEKESTMRIIGKRNQKRLDALKKEGK